METEPFISKGDTDVITVVVSVFEVSMTAHINTPIKRMLTKMVGTKRVMCFKEFPFNFGLMEIIENLPYYTVKQIFMASCYISIGGGV